MLDPRHLHLESLPPRCPHEPHGGLPRLRPGGARPPVAARGGARRLARRRGHRRPGAGALSALSIEGRVVDEAGRAGRRRLALPARRDAVRHGPASRVHLVLPADARERARAGRGRRPTAAALFASTASCPRDYAIQAVQHSSVASVRLDGVPAGADDVLLRLPTHDVDRVAGRVVGLDGAGVAGVRIQVSRTIEGMGFVFAGAGTTDAQGRFVLENVATDGVRLSLDGEGHRPGDRARAPPRVLRRGAGGARDRRRPQVSPAARVGGSGPRIGRSRAVGRRGRASRSGWCASAEGGWSPRDEVRAHGELSEVLSVSEAGAEIVVAVDGVEARRVPVRLVPGRVERVEL